MYGAKRQQLQEQLKVVLAASKVANKVALAATKAYVKNPSKFTLAASDRATKAFIAALAANRAANDAIIALVHAASGSTPPNVQ